MLYDELTRNYQGCLANLTLNCRKRSDSKLELSVRLDVHSHQNVSITKAYRRPLGYLHCRLLMIPAAVASCKEGQVQPAGMLFPVACKLKSLTGRPGLHD